MAGRTAPEASSVLIVSTSSTRNGFHQSNSPDHRSPRMRQQRAQHHRRQDRERCTTERDVDTRRREGAPNRGGSSGVSRCRRSSRTVRRSSCSPPSCSRSRDPTPSDRTKSTLSVLQTPVTSAPSGLRDLHREWTHIAGRPVDEHPVAGMERATVGAAETLEREHRRVRQRRGILERHARSPSARTPARGRRRTRRRHPGHTRTGLRRRDRRAGTSLRPARRTRRHQRHRAQR